MGLADKWQVELFLRDFKASWVPACFVVPRDPNNQALLDLGLTPFQRREIILNLQTENYSEGPLTDDKDGQVDVWIFGCGIDGIEVYIKLKLGWTPRGNVARCLSFHAAQRPLSYPFREPTGGKPQ